MIAVNFLWGSVDGLMYVFTSLLEKGRYNKMVTTLKTGAKNTIRETLAKDLDKTIIGMTDKHTAQQVMQMLLDAIAATDIAALKKPSISINEHGGRFSIAVRTTSTM